EELLGTLIERGALHGDRWDEGLVPGETAVPDTVQAVLGARIDLLPSQEKAALHAAAVIGRTFWSSAVRELLGGAEPDFRALEQRDFVRRRSGSSLEAEREYVFEDALALLARGLELEPQVQCKIQILEETARVHTLRYDAQGFRAAMEEALSLEPEPAVAAEIYAQLAYYSLGRAYMWREPPPRELCEQWLAKALEFSEPDAPARAWALLARAVSDPSARVETAEEVHRLGEALGDPRLVVFAYEAQTLAAIEATR